MQFDDYQTEAFKTALPTTQTIEYMLLGLANEAGETAGKLKKVLRGDETMDVARDKIADELADCLWYIAGAATVLDIPMNYLASKNLAKLKDRQARGVLRGSGDSR